MKKTIYSIIAIVLSVFLLTACSAGGNSQQAPGGASDQAKTPAATADETAQSSSVQGTAANEKVFTREELSKYDGQNGNPAYIAVDGVVYDVTNVPQWRNGMHRGGYQAGRDLTDAFQNNSPHDSSIFNGIPVVGKYKG